jgi:hypothetical protein
MARARPGRVFKKVRRAVSRFRSWISSIIGDGHVTAFPYWLQHNAEQESV